MNSKFVKKTQGAISIFLVLIMLPMFTCAGLIVDGARISAARTALTGAGDLTMNAALSEYDKVLLDVYGLFAMSETTEDLEKNVSRYFSNTINNAGILQSSDSYTRSFINSIGSMFSSDDISFDNIVDTNVEKFSLVEVPNSALGNPTVLERQIIEYMKYRGPISIGSGLLTKLGCIGETSKQTKAVEAKVDYEKKLDTVQDACETAYKAINSFNDAVNDSPYSNRDYLTVLNSDLGEAYQATKSMAEYIIAAKSPAYKVGTLNENEDLKKSIQQEVKSLSGDNVNLQVYDLMKEKLKSDIDFEVDSKGNYKQKDSQFKTSINQLAGGIGDTFQQQINYAAAVKHNLGEYSKIYTYIVTLDNYYKKLSEDERKERQKEHDLYLGVSASMKMIINAAKNLPDQWKNKANEKGRSASKKLYNNWYSPLSDLDKKLKDAIEALDAVLKKVDELDSARSTWSTKVDALSESDVKTSMKGDYENSAKYINTAAINSLKQVLQDNRTHFTKIKEKLDEVKLYEQKICISNSDSINYYDRYSSIPEYSLTDGYDVYDRAEIVMKNYKNTNMKEGINPATFITITEEQQFYKYLKRVCATVDGKTTEDEKKKTESAKNDRKDLINKGNTDQKADVSNITKGNYVTDSGLTADISAAISALAKAQDAGGATSFDPSDLTPDGKKDKKRADEAKKNLTGVSNMLESLSNVAEVARDKVYTEEYFTEMFSCYTSGKGTDKGRTLSNKELKDNKFFGSEVEYILYGKPTVEENLNAAKASIFGVRFALNSIYALTSSYTRTPALTAATAIAGWTGFGVPIVQTVILLAWSMAESVNDVDQLCKGEAVALYKSEETWVLGINGVVKAGKELAGAVIDDVFTQIENTATDSIDSISGTVNKYVENTTTGLVDSIQSSIMTGIEKLAVQIVGESNYSLTEQAIGQKVDDFLNSLSSTANGDSTTDKATKLAVEALKAPNVRNYLVSQIYSAYSEAKDGAVSAVSSKIESMLKSIEREVVNSITGAVSSVGEDLKNKVSNIVQEGGDQVKEKVTSAIDDYIGDLGGSSASGGASVASGFSLTYKEYLKAFVMMYITVKEDAMMKRCAELIQANVSMKNSTFNIAKSYTMVEVNATVTIRTTFFDVPVSAGVDEEGNTVYGLDFSNIGTGRQKIKYVGILGY